MNEVTFYGSYDCLDEPLYIGHMVVDAYVPFYTGMRISIVVGDYQYLGYVSDLFGEFNLLQNEQDLSVCISCVEWRHLITNGKSGSGLSPVQQVEVDDE